jgi:hypothetical protein
MVPLFSGKHSHSSKSSESVQEHVAIVLQQAIAYAKLLQQFITRDLDITRLWPISGYGAYMVGNVFVVSFRIFIATASGLEN